MRLLLLALFPVSVFAAELPTIAVALRYLDASSTSVAGLTDATRVVTKFWNVNSAGKHTFPTTVHPAVLQLNKNKPTGTYCNYSFMGDAYNAIVAAGIDLTKYKRLVPGAKRPSEHFKPLVSISFPSRMSLRYHTTVAVHPSDVGYDGYEDRLLVRIPFSNTI